MDLKQSKMFPIKQTAIYTDLKQGDKVIKRQNKHKIKTN